jgi:hypothetical protein
MEVTVEQVLLLTQVQVQSLVQEVVEVVQMSEIALLTLVEQPVEAEEQVHRVRVVEQMLQQTRVGVEVVQLTMVVPTVLVVMEAQASS